MTRVVHVGPDPYGSSVGGMAAVIRTLVETAPYPVSVVPSWWERGFPPVGRLLQSLIQVLRTPRGDVVHVHLSERGSWLREGAFVLAARVSGKNVALTLHGAELGAWASKRLVRAGMALVLRAADVVFVLHDADGALVRSISRTQVRLIVNPVAAEPGPPEPLDEGTGPAPVVFLGEQSRRKGIDVLAAAWPQVLARRPDVRLVLAGPITPDGGPSGAGVLNLGAVSPQRARVLLRGASLIVLPSRAEALPMVLLEAMAEGVPFVATHVAGIPRLAAAGAGVTVEPDDVDGLAAALLRMLDDDALRAGLGSAGKAWWEQHGRPEAVHAALVTGYFAPASKG